MTTPYVEDIVVVRRRLRMNEDGETEQQLVVWATLRDSDYLIGMLERAKWAVGDRNYTHEPDMKVEGLTEPKEDAS